MPVKLHICLHQDYSDKKGYERQRVGDFLVVFLREIIAKLLVLIDSKLCYSGSLYWVPGHTDHLVGASS